MDLKTYTLGELEPYLTPLFSNPDSTLPLSPLRLRSYLANPRAESRDPVLFEMYHENELVGYRTLLPDLYYDQEGVPQRFAWLSGNYVHPRMRRRGISSTLLAEAEERWAGKLMYTNYAPDSKALYDHTGRFFALINRDGQRYYLRSNTEELLGKRVNARGLLRLGDRVVNQIRERQLTQFRFPEQNSYSVECKREPSPEMEKSILKVQQKSLFRRDANLFRWALENPWVTDAEVPPLPYHFSYKSEKFRNILYEFRHKETGSLGMLWLIRHNSALSVPYLFAEDAQLIGVMAATLIEEMIKSGCSHTTIRQAALNSHMEAYQKIFLSSKEMPQLIFAHRNMAASVPSNKIIHDGDGDVMFTG